MPRANIPISPDHHPAPNQARPRLLAHCALIFLIGSLIIASPSPAQADGEHEVSGGRLDWGLRDSFVNYISGPIAKGDAELTDGLSTNSGEFRFHSADGTYSDSGELTISYQGRVHFTGHEQDDGSYELDLAIANPTIEITDSGATLYVDIDRPDGFFEQTEFADLSIDASAVSDQDETVAASDIAATLTSEGAESFAGFYEAGEELNTVSFSGDLAAPTEEPVEEDDGEELPNAVLDWGVRDTWRDFVTGDIADGGWDVDHSAEDGGAVFRFIETEPRTAADDLDVDDLELAFSGELSFWGDDVDLTLTDPHVLVSEDHGEITAEVDSERVVLATFASEWTEADGQARLDEVSTELAEEAVDHFHGFYQAGDAMDPVTVIVPLEADAVAPDLPNLGSEPLTEAAAEETTDDAGLPWALIAAIAGGVIVLLGLVWLVARSRSTSKAPTDEDNSSQETQPDEDDSSDQPQSAESDSSASSSSTPAPDSQKNQETE